MFGANKVAHTKCRFFQKLAVSATLLIDVIKRVEEIEVANWFDSRK